MNSTRLWKPFGAGQLLGLHEPEQQHQAGRGAGRHEAQDVAGPPGREDVHQQQRRRGADDRRQHQERRDGREGDEGEERAAVIHDAVRGEDREASSTTIHDECTIVSSSFDR